MQKIKNCLKYWWLIPLVLLFLLNFNPMLGLLAENGPYPYALTDQYGFAYMGRMWVLKGVLPYLEIFDQKGPLLFLFCGIGELVTSLFTSEHIIKFGFYITLIPLKLFEYFILFKIYNLYFDEKKSAIYTLLTTLFTMAFTFGGTCEEFMTPFIVCSVYLALKSYETKDVPEKTLTRNCVLIGFCVGAIVMIRINNALYALGLLPLIFPLCKKQNTSPVKFIVAAFVGFCFSVLPFAIYFAINGAFAEFLEGILLFGIKYAGKMNAGRGGTLNALLWLMSYGFFVPTFLSLISAVFVWKKDRAFSLSLLLTTGLILFSVVMGGKNYHYAYAGYVLYPLFVIGLVKANVMKKDIIILIALVASSISMTKSIPDILDTYKAQNDFNEKLVSEKAEFEEIYETIESYNVEVESVMAFSIDAYFYYASDTVPNHRYWAWEEQWIQIYPEICNEIYSQMVEDDPTMVLISTEVAEQSCPAIYEKVTNEYTFLNDDIGKALAIKTDYLENHSKK